jgi:hypothetical protein
MSDTFEHLYTLNNVLILDSWSILDTTNQVFIDRTETDFIRFWQGHRVSATDGTCNNPEFIYDNEPINTFAALFPSSLVSLSMNEDIILPGGIGSIGAVSTLSGYGREPPEVFIDVLQYVLDKGDHVVNIFVEDFTIADATGWEFRIRNTNYQSTNGCSSGTGFGSWSAWIGVTSGLSYSVGVSPGASFPGFYTAVEVQVGPRIPSEPSEATDESCRYIQG